MIVQRVEYLVFPHEADSRWSTDLTAWHQLDGQIALDLADGDTMFVSWGSEPLQFCIEHKRHSLFGVGVLTAIDMTQHPYWQPVVGQEIELRFVDAEHQVLGLGNEPHRIFISSQYDDGEFYGDCVCVSATSPIERK